MTQYQHKYGLALHTTTPQLGICLDNFKSDRRSQIWNLGRDLSSLLHQHLRSILAPQTWQDLEFIAVAKGPGGFTGTRMGVVTARTIAQQLNIPLYGISTLAAIAHSQQDKPESNSLIAVQMNARREQLFVAIYQIAEEGIWQPYLPDTVMTASEWHKTLSDLKLSYELVKSPSEIANTVTNIMELAYAQWRRGKKSAWQEVVPFYGQHPVK
ncbi:MAG: tRNA (adenosine(37)-N6)-threonylcarbamoyltransferase complex dimerization subunit type 1 TsaB [Xenococcus sp. MO_188.B8]|nr:tRNA (adenosine(37)-N6)-threonylcarbamoyltransferase complex dimerization subunit type 1 TsaB [Xenococcus sp. MO_188.B8]